MRNNKKLFLLMVLVMGIVTNFSLSVNTISVFAEANHKTEAEQSINTLESTSLSQENEPLEIAKKISSQNKYKLFPATGEKRKNKLFYIGMIIIIFTITSYNLRKNKK